MTDPNWNKPGDFIAGEVIAVDGNAITLRTDDGREVTLGARKKMDPNQALHEARNAVGDYRNAIRAQEVEKSANKLADTFEALDKWLIQGGILPADWLPAKRRANTFTSEPFPASSIDGWIRSHAYSEFTTDIRQMLDEIRPGWRELFEDKQ